MEELCLAADVRSGRRFSNNLAYFMLSITELLGSAPVGGRIVR
jgi:hypothetical protein